MNFKKGGKMKTFIINWVDEVCFEAVIEAENKTEAEKEFHKSLFKHTQEIRSNLLKNSLINEELGQ